ncbi:hypothetical protein Bca52824_084076 [Brassica carinata]|uniref:Uncharacterized protein n=1 Tax=Brassica carinata TaxID=52824 RepID=A0A8X7PLY0_BRACI|nr:hypothetical protein Bca52824_084076 [Brassica carinata]
MSIGAMQEIEETAPLIDDSQPSGETRSQSATTKVPEVEIHLYRSGKGPIDVFKSNLGGWEQDQLEVRAILEKYGLKSIFAFNVEKGRGVPIRFQRNGRSVLTYRDGATVYIDGEPQVISLFFLRILLIVFDSDDCYAVNNVSNEGPASVDQEQHLHWELPPWVLACIVIVFTRARKRTRDFFRKYGW